jgi:hypothetical protein
MRARSRLSSAIAVIVTGTFFIATVSPAFAQSRGGMWTSGTRRQQQQAPEHHMQAPAYGGGAGGAPRKQGWFSRHFPGGSDKRAAAIGAGAGGAAALVLAPHAAIATGAAVAKAGVGVAAAGLTAGKVLVSGLVAATGPIGAVLIIGGGAYLLVRRIQKGRAARQQLAAREEQLMAREAELMEAENIIMQRAQELGQAEQAMMARAGGAGAAAEAEEAEALARERAAAGEMGGAEEALAAEEAARRAGGQRGGPAAAAEAEEIAREAERLEAAMAEPAAREPVVRSERGPARQPAGRPAPQGNVGPAPVVAGGQLAAMERQAVKDGKQLVVVQPRLISSAKDPKTGTVREQYVAADGITMKVSTWRVGKSQKIMKDVRVYKDGQLIPELSWRHETKDERITTLKDGSKMRTSRWVNGKTPMQDVGMRDAKGNFMGSIRSRSPEDVK